MTTSALFDLFTQHNAVWLIAASVFSLLVGSFLNVLILRLPKAMQEEWEHECQILLQPSKQDQEPLGPALAVIAWPASHCPSCLTPLKAWHNIPVISYVLLRGKCTFCSINISSRYPLVELLTAALGLLVAWVLGPHVSTLMALILVYMLVALAVIDLDHKLLPDQLTLPLMWLGLIVNAMGIITSLEDAFWGAVAGYLCLWLIY